MSIWVRSQDKTLLIELGWCAITPRVINSTTMATDGFEIRGDCGVTEDGSFFVGRYPTEEEALEVLDMIQEHINRLDVSSLLPIPSTGTQIQINHGPKHFQMPPAGFSQGDGEVRE